MAVELKLYENFNLQEKPTFDEFWLRPHFEIRAKEGNLYSQPAFSYASALSEISDYSNVHSKHKFFSF